MLTVFNFLFFVGQFYALSDRGSLRYRVTIRWTLVSLAIFPLYVLGERWYMSNSKMEMKPLLVDAGLVTFWILLFFGVMLLTLGHNAIL